MDELKEAKKLLRRGMSYVGMISEIKMKADLFRREIENAKPEEVEAKRAIYKSRLAQMKEDLATYTRKIDEINEELQDYDIFNDMA